ncbi:MAG: hypothetical protein K6T61_17275 [Bryobacteraceae bacterium]|nr:hypothetical protein [Bryobacteraceae bacterium]
MWEDPIVADVHRIREKLAAEFNFDVTAIFADLRKRQPALGARLVPQKNEPNRRLKLTGAAIPVLRSPRPPRRPRQLSLGVERNAARGRWGGERESVEAMVRCWGSEAASSAGIRERLGIAAAGNGA